VVFLGEFYHFCIGFRCIRVGFRKFFPLALIIVELSAKRIKIAIVIVSDISIEYEMKLVGPKIVPCETHISQISVLRVNCNFCSTAVDVTDLYILYSLWAKKQCSQEIASSVTPIFFSFWSNY
jgi:hypothetical protein